MNTELHEILVRNMKLYRSKLGISQMELAERAGLSSGYVGEIEMGRKFPSPEALIQLASALEVKPFRLLMGAEDVAEWLGDEAFYAATDEVVEDLRKGLDEMRKKRQGGDRGGRSGNGS